MKQKELRVVIDEFCTAMEALVPNPPPGAVERLRAALGDLLEAFGTAATHLGIAPVVSVLQEQEAIVLKIEAVVADIDVENARIGAIERRADARRAVSDDLQMQIDSLSDRTGVLEEAQPDVGTVPD